MKRMRESGKFLGMLVLVNGFMGCNEILGWDLPEAGEPRSCAGIDATCGVEKNQDCCASPMVFPDAGIRRFRLDAFEVTVDRFKAYLVRPGAGDNETRDYGSATKSCPDATFQALNNSNLPINCVTWQQASQFCEWDDARLPELEEFNLAAGVGTRKFPWGQEPVNETRAVISPVDRPASVGTKPDGGTPDNQYEHDSVRRVYDLVGNVQEWTQEKNCFGGSFNTISESEPDTPDPVAALDGKANKETGFRCARNP